MVTERGQQAAARAGAALSRGRELARQLAEMRDGKPCSERAYARSVQAANQAVDLAVLALIHAADAHHRAATLHRQLADVLDQIGQPDRAAEHRRLAEADDAEGDADHAASVGDLVPNPEWFGGQNPSVVREATGR